MSEEIDKDRMDSRFDGKDKGKEERNGVETVDRVLLTVGAENRGDRERCLFLSSGRIMPRLNRTCGENFEPSK